jgi:glutamate carboxypeptidase
MSLHLTFPARLLPHHFSLAALLLPLAAISAAQTPPSPLSPTELEMARSIDAHLTADLAFLQQLVDINSGTMNLSGVEAVEQVLAPRFTALGFSVKWVPMRDQTARAGDLVAIHPCPAGSGHCGKRLLLIGHMDTVFEPASPFQKYALVPNSGDKSATGPAVSDMKGGLVVMLSALTAMREAGVLENSEIRVVLSGDEERVGTPFALARRDLVDAAKQSDVALEFEPGGLLDGKDSVSIGRRSSTTWNIEATGISGHSSQIFGEKLGYGAIYELARIVDAFRTQLREDGLTYSTGLVLGGSSAQINAEATGGSATGKSNVIAATAIATGDIRTLNDEQTARTEAKMRDIVAAHLPKTSATITFSEGYPAMARTPVGEKLLAQWNDASTALGLGPVAEAGPMTRGAGDISFVAPIIPGLVGVGILGEGAHAAGETAWLDSLPRQAKRNAVLMERLTHMMAAF